MFASKRVAIGGISKSLGIKRNLNALFFFIGELKMTRIYSSKTISPEEVPKEILNNVKAHICRGNMVGCHLGVAIHPTRTITGKSHYSSKKKFQIHMYRINYDINGKMISVSALGRCKHDYLQYKGVDLYEDDVEINDIESTIDLILLHGHLIDRFGGKIAKEVKQSIAASNRGEFVRALSKASNANQYGRHGMRFNSTNDELIDAIIEMIEIYCNEGMQTLAESELQIAIAEEVRKGKFLKNASFLTVERFIADNQISA